MSLMDLARSLDSLDPAADWKKRTEIGEQMKVQLGDRYGAFVRGYEALCAVRLTGKNPAGDLVTLVNVAEVTLRVLEALAEKEEPQTATPPGDAAEGGEQARLDRAVAAYRKWRTLAQQPEVLPAELASASAAWTGLRDRFEPSTSAARQLQAATEQIDAQFQRARRRPVLHTHQLPGAVKMPSTPTRK